MLALALLFAGCLEYEAPPPPPPPPGADERTDISLIPPGGASADQGAGGAPRIREVAITPGKPMTTDDLRAGATVVDRDSPNPDIDYVWILNGQERPDLTTEVLPADLHRKGDTVAVKVIANDGESTVEQVSDTLTILNSPPQFVGDPNASGQVDGVTVKATDPDQDPLTWTLSGQPPGMSFDKTRGLLTYTSTKEAEGGDYQVKLTVEDGDGGKAEWSFDLSVSPGSEAVERKKKEAEAAAAASGI